MQAYGLKALLEEYFSPKQVELLSDQSAAEVHSFGCDLLFVQARCFFTFSDRLSSIRNKVIIISHSPTPHNGVFPVLYTAQEQTNLLDSLNNILNQKLKQQKVNHDKPDLSEREREVLTLIAKGEMNKTIADKLNISLNTVLTHRKNITAKLDIKTVSGLTVYAILNGLISADEV